MKNKETKSLLFYVGIAIVVVCFLMSVTSCSSRKVNKSEVKEEATTEQTIKEETTTNTDTNTKIVDTSETTEIEFIPVDNTKPILIDGKKYDNVIVRRVNKKNNVVTVENEKVSQIAKKEGKTKSNKVVEVKQKQTEAKRPFFWWWIILVVGVVIFIYRKYLRQWI